MELMLSGPVSSMLDAHQLEDFSPIAPLGTPRGGPEGPRSNPPAAQPQQQQRSGSGSCLEVEKAAELKGFKRSASLPAMYGSGTSPVARLEIEAKPPATEREAALADIAAVPGPPFIAAPAAAVADDDAGAMLHPLPCTPRGGRSPAGGAELAPAAAAVVPAPPAPAAAPLPPARSRAMALDFDLTLIPRHTGGMPAPGQPLAPGKYLHDLRAHLSDLVQADFDLFIVTRGDVRAVRAALTASRDPADPDLNGGLASWFRGIYGADEARGASPPISKRGDSFTLEDMRQIKSIAPSEVWARLSPDSPSKGRRGGEEDATAAAEADVNGEYRVEAEDGDGRALVGRENANLANKWWWGWQKCEYLQQIMREGGYSDGKVWFGKFT